MGTRWGKGIIVVRGKGTEVEGQAGLEEGYGRGVAGLEMRWRRLEGKAGPGLGRVRALPYQRLIPRNHLSSENHLFGEH